MIGGQIKSLERRVVKKNGHSKCVDVLILVGDNLKRKRETLHYIKGVGSVLTC